MVEHEMPWSIDEAASKHLGQTTGLASSVDDKVFLFTRVDREWRSE